MAQHKDYEEYDYPHMWHIGAIKQHAIYTLLYLKEGETFCSKETAIEELQKLIYKLTEEEKSIRCKHCLNKPNEEGGTE